MWSIQSFITTALVHVTFTELMKLLDDGNEAYWLELAFIQMEPLSAVGKES